jgi:TonB family protein
MAGPGPMFYQPQPRWQLVVAIFAALALHGLAAVIAGIRDPEPVMDLADIPEAVAEVAFEPETTEPEPTPEPEEEEEPEMEEMPPTPMDQPEFVDEQPTPTPRPQRTPRERPAAPIARPKPTGVGVPGPMSMSAARAKAVSAPRPEYPYEARRMRLTGSGVVLMTVDPGSGAVTSAVMAQSTGHPVLDNAALSAFRRWRFQPGTVSRVRTPITFTMTGAQF